jgi:hypothetical protein
LGASLAGNELGVVFIVHAVVAVRRTGMRGC